MHRLSQLFFFIFAITAAPAIQAEPPAQEQRWIQGIGYVEPGSEIRRLAFKHPGILGEYKVAIDQTVKTGEVLAVQRNSEEQVGVKVAESQLQLAQANLAQTLAGAHPEEIEAKKNAQHYAAVDAEYAERKLQRIERLQSNKFVSEDDRDLAETTAKLKQAANRRTASETHYLTHYVRDVDQHAAKAQVVVAEARLQEAKQTLAETILTSPINGVVLENILRVGESTFAAGSPEPVLLVGDLSHLRVRAEIDENYAFQLHAGQKAVLFGRGLGDKEIPAHISLVKKMMGKKTVFAKTATERKDIDIIQVFVEPDIAFTAPVGLEVNVKIMLN
jgi:multidrug resistance efflux pump